MLLYITNLLLHFFLQHTQKHAGHLWSCLHGIACDILSEIILSSGRYTMIQIAHGWFHCSSTAAEYTATTIIMALLGGEMVKFRGARDRFLLRVVSWKILRYFSTYNIITIFIYNLLFKWNMFTYLKNEVNLQIILKMDPKVKVKVIIIWFPLNPTIFVWNVF